jgi:hypothetical protein
MSRISSRIRQGGSSCDDLLERRENFNRRLEKQHHPFARLIMSAQATMVQEMPRS